MTFKKGEPSWNKGRHLSKEHREGIARAHQGKPSWNKGKTMTEEHKQHLRESWERRHKKGFWGRIFE